MPAVHRPLAVLVARERGDQPLADLDRHLAQVHHLARAGRALDLEVVAVVAVQLEQRAQDHEVHREPDRPAPVRVAAEHPAVGLGRQVADLVVLAAPVEPYGSSRWRAEIARMPCGPRNSSSSSITFRIWRSCVVVTSASIRRPVAVRRRARGRGPARRRRSARRSRARVRPGRAGRDRSASNTVAAHSGSSPTSERTFSGIDVAVRHPHHVVEEAVLLVPQRRVGAGRVERDRDPREVPDELQRDVVVGRVLARRARPRSAASTGSRGPSRPCRRPAAASRRRAAARSGRRCRCCRARGTRPGTGCARRGPCGSPTSEVRQQALEHARQQRAVARAADLGLALGRPTAPPTPSRAG